MSAALTPLLASAAAVLVLAGVAKLRAPAGAAEALRSLGLPGRVLLVRALGAFEVGLGAICLLDPVRVLVCGLAVVYGIFAVVSLLLVRRRASCGCFGDTESPASVAQTILSVALGSIAIAAAVGGVHGIGWVLGRSVPGAPALVAAIAGSAYAIVLAYTQLPAAWVAWER